MARYYLTGGSTGNASLIRTSSAAWSDRVHDTAAILLEFGVGESDTVLIAQPSFPWSIGEDFAAAAIQCGANSICLGTHAFDSSAIPHWMRLGVRYVFAPPKLLSNLAGLDCSPMIAIVAGQPLSREEEHLILATTPVEKILRIYGNAELGSLGYQTEANEVTYRLNPRFEYRLENSDSEDPISKRLVIRWPEGEFWTKDRAQLTNETSDASGLWAPGRNAQLRGRIDIVHHFRDGTSLNSDILERVRSNLNLQDLQLHIDETSDTDRVLAVYASEAAVTPIDVERAINSLSSDLQQSLNLRTIQIEAVQKTIGDFAMNGRGKRPPFVVMKGA